MHFHEDALNLVFYGAKAWRLVPPAFAEYSTAHPGPAFRAGRREGPGVACVQPAGTALLVPRGWGHATVNLQETVGIAVELDRNRCTLARCPALRP